MNALKDKVLESQVEFLYEELGDPGRYLPQLRSKGILSLSDCQMIRTKETFREKIEALVNSIKGRVSTKNEHSFDVLVDALKKQRVQAHIAKVLQKALAKAKEIMPIASGTRSENNLEQKQFMQQAHQISIEGDKNCGHEFHPEHGQLPLPPPSGSAHTMDTCSYDASASDEDGEHPAFGKLPASCNSGDDMMVYAIPHSVRWTSNSEFLESSSESELGGQGQFNKSSLISDAIPQSFSTATGSLSDSSSSSTAQEESIEVIKLKAIVQDLRERLQEAHSRLDEKNVTIHELEKKLQECQYKREEDRMFSKDAYRTEAAYPQAIKHSSTQCYRTAPSISPNSSDGFQHRGTETVAYNNYINYSRNSTTSASVSTV